MRLLFVTSRCEVHFPLRTRHYPRQRCKTLPFVVQCSGVTDPRASRGVARFVDRRQMVTVAKTSSRAHLWATDGGACQRHRSVPRASSARREQRSASPGLPNVTWLQTPSSRAPRELLCRCTMTCADKLPDEGTNFRFAPSCSYSSVPYTCFNRAK